MDVANYSEDADGVPFIKISNYELKLDLSELDGYFKERAQEELRENPDNVQNGLAELRRLIKDDNTLRLPDDNPYLIKFLRPCKFYPESAYELIRRYYIFLHKNKKYSEDVLPSAVKEVFLKEIFEFLPVRANGSRILILNIKNWNPKEISIDLLVKSVLMMTEIASIEPKTQVSGAIILIDAAGLSLHHVATLTPWLVKSIMEYIQECLPVRLKGLHIVNQHFIFNIAFNLFKPFIGEKLKRKMFLHGQKWNSLSKCIPKDCIPQRYGGDVNIPIIPGHLLIKMFDKYTPQYKDILEYGYFPN